MDKKCAEIPKIIRSGKFKSISYPGLVQLLNYPMTPQDRKIILDRLVSMNNERLNDDKEEELILEEETFDKEKMKAYHSNMKEIKKLFGEIKMIKKKRANKKL